MPVDVLLLCIRTGSGLRGHESVSHLVRVNILVVFVVGLKPTDGEAKGLGIVLRNIKFDSRGIKGEELSQRGIALLADWVYIIDYALEHEFNLICKAEFEVGKEERVKDFRTICINPNFFVELWQEDR